MSADAPLAPQSFVGSSWADAEPEDAPVSAHVDEAFEHEDLAAATLKIVEDQLPTRPPYKVYIGNLHFSTTINDIEQLLRECKIKDVQLPTDRNTGKFRGFCYAEFEDVESVKTALLLGGVEFKGRSVKVDVAQDRGNRRNNNRNNNRDNRRNNNNNNNRDNNNRDNNNRDNNNRDNNSRDFGNRDNRDNRDFQRGNNRNQRSFNRGRNFDNNREDRPGQYNNFGPSDRNVRDNRDNRDNRNFRDNRDNRDNRRPAGRYNRDRPAPTNPDLPDEVSAPPAHLRLKLKPRSSSGNADSSANNSSSIFGGARPREQVLAERKGSAPNDSSKNNSSNNSGSSNRRSDNSRGVRGGRSGNVRGRGGLASRSKAKRQQRQQRAPRPVVVEKQELGDDNAFAGFLDDEEDNNDE
jgi:RNA recognition motif-containing protein